MIGGRVWKFGDNINTDLMLPGTDGLSLCRWIRGRSSLPRHGRPLLACARRSAGLRRSRLATGV